jgi:hypothetical protein
VSIVGTEVGEVTVALDRSSLFAFTLPDVSEHSVPVCSVRNDCKTPSLVVLLRPIFGGGG